MTLLGTKTLTKPAKAPPLIDGFNSKNPAQQHKPITACICNTEAIALFWRKRFIGRADYKDRPFNVQRFYTHNLVVFELLQAYSTVLLGRHQHNPTRVVLGAESVHLTHPGYCT